MVAYRQAYKRWWCSSLEGQKPCPDLIIGHEQADRIERQIQRVHKPGIARSVTVK